MCEFLWEINRLEDLNIMFCVDEHSKIFVFFMKAKSEAFQYSQEFQSMAEKPKITDSKDR